MVALMFLSFLILLYFHFVVAPTIINTNLVLHRLYVVLYICALSARNGCSVVEYPCTAAVSLFSALFAIEQLARFNCEMLGNVHQCELKTVLNP